MHHNPSVFASTTRRKQLRTLLLYLSKALNLSNAEIGRMWLDLGLVKPRTDDEEDARENAKRQVRDQWNRSTQTTPRRGKQRSAGGEESMESD